MKHKHLQDAATSEGNLQHCNTYIRKQEKFYVNDLSFQFQLETEEQIKHKISKESNKDQVEINEIGIESMTFFKKSMKAKVCSWKRSVKLVNIQSALSKETRNKLPHQKWKKGHHY